MELKLRKTDLLRELQLFQGIVERKNTIPVLANVLMEAEGDQLQMLATDLEVSLRSRCSATVAAAGSVTAPAKKLYEVIRALPETDVLIRRDSNGAVKVAADRFDSRIQTLPHEDFPTIAAPAGTASHTLPRGAIREMVSRTQFAITGEDTRYFLNGALLVLKGSEINLVATDGHRLALVTVGQGKEDAESAEAEAEEVRAILPKKTLWELSRLLVDGDTDIRYERDDNHLFFDIDSRQLVSRVIDAQFPAYDRVIPRGTDKAVEFERDRLTSAIRRVALLSSDHSRAVRFTFSEGAVQIASNSPEVGEANESVEVDFAGDPLTICFNAQYVVDFLNVAETDTVRLEFKDEMSQAVMRPVGHEGYDYTYVIMPMRA